MQLPPPPVSGSFAKFDVAGTEYEGLVIDINGDGTDFNGNKCPQVVLDRGEAGHLTITCGQAQLWSKTVAAVDSGELRVGVWAKFAHTHVEKRTGGKTLKHFDIKVSEAPASFKASTVSAGHEPF